MTESAAEVLLEQYHLKAVIDLRTFIEREEMPDYGIAGVEYLHIPLFDEARAGSSHEKSTRDMDARIPDMTDLYRRIVTDECSAARIKEVIGILNDNRREGAVLWHCTEGKDRCGIISAWFLLSKGIEQDTVMRDYLKTNETAEKRAAYYYNVALEKCGSVAVAEKVRDAFLAKRGYMEPVIDILAQRFMQA
jgi:protein-tyrosine phosphatase